MAAAPSGFEALRSAKLTVVCGESIGSAAVQTVARVQAKAPRMAVARMRPRLREVIMLFMEISCGVKKNWPRNDAFLRFIHTDTVQGPNPTSGWEIFLRCMDCANAIPLRHRGKGRHY